jgi:hypothetical protein
MTAAVPSKPPMGQKPPKAKPDPAYLAKVAERPCYVCQMLGLPQDGRTYVHHPICGRYGQRKAPDMDAVPLCWQHHQGPYGVHADKAAFIARFGPDTDAIAPTRAAILGDA